MDGFQLWDIPGISQNLLPWDIIIKNGNLLDEGPSRDLSSEVWLCG
jgi:hypothetical protein